MCTPCAAKEKRRLERSGLQVLTNMQQGKSLPQSGAAAKEREQRGCKVPDASDNCMPVMTKLHRG